MDSQASLNLIVTVNIATLVAIIVVGYKIVTAFNDITFKTNLMWQDYEYRMKQYQIAIDSQRMNEAHE